MTTIDMFDPSYIPQSFAIQSMRDNGYKNTAYALAEIIDNSVQAGADNVTVFCVSDPSVSGGRSISKIAVLDDGCGMDSKTLRDSVRFGVGSHLNDREGIGRFGMGLPNSSISQCRRLTVYSWQDGPDNAMKVHLDVDEITSGSVMGVEDPQHSPLPEEWRRHQEALHKYQGTLVQWENFSDAKRASRLTWKTSIGLFNNLEEYCGRIYRKLLYENKLTLTMISIDGESVSLRNCLPNDPMFLMTPCNMEPPYDNTPMFELWGESTTFLIPFNGKAYPVTVSASVAINDTVERAGAQDRGRTNYGQQARKNMGVSLIRADRELDLDASWCEASEPRDRWWGIEVDFSAELDEIFGVTNTKQSATTFSSLAKLEDHEWQDEADENETFQAFKDRLREQGDYTGYLWDIKIYIRQLRNSLITHVRNQAKGNRTLETRHEDENSVEAKATKGYEERKNQGYFTPGDQKSTDKQAIVKEATTKGYPQADAEKIAEFVYQNQRRIMFLRAPQEGESFFSVREHGNVTVITLDEDHPAYSRLLGVLEDDTTSLNEAELCNQIETAADTMKMLLAAWARFELEQPTDDAVRRLRELRTDWGRMCRRLMAEM